MRLAVQAALYFAIVWLLAAVIFKNALSLDELDD